MSVFVLDASVIVKWFVPEVGTQDALRLLALPHDYFAPDLIFAEAANAIWKKVRRGDVRIEDGARLVADIVRAGVASVPCRALVEDAHAVACATGQTMYNALYVTLAVRLETRVLTADSRLDAAFRAIPALAEHVQLLQSFRG